MKMSGKLFPHAWGNLPELTQASRVLARWVRCAALEALDVGRQAGGALLAEACRLPILMSAGRAVHLVDQSLDPGGDSTTRRGSGGRDRGAPYSKLP